VSFQEEPALQTQQIQGLTWSDAPKLVSERNSVISDAHREDVQHVPTVHDERVLTARRFFLRTNPDLKISW